MLCISKQRPTQNPHKQLEVQKTINQQQQTQCLRTDIGGINAFYWRHIFALDSVISFNRMEKLVGWFALFVFRMISDECEQNSKTRI